MAKVADDMRELNERLGEVNAKLTKELTYLRAVVHALRLHYGAEIDKVLREKGLGGVCKSSE